MRDRDAIPALKLTIAYDGTAFRGSQRQAAGRTVQEELERSLGRLGFERPATVFAGRTDRGVHAVGQVVRCGDERPDWGEDKIARAINAMLPDDIAVNEVGRISAGFHPRYDAIWREYRYRIWCGNDQPMVRHQVWNRRAPLDVDRMTRAARLLIGTHDLAAFTGGGEGVPWSARARAPRGTVRTIFHCGVRDIGPWWGIGPGDGYGIEVRVIADGFLPQLVRTIVGALTAIGMNRQPADWITRLIGEADRRRGPETAPSHGLVLWRIGYGDEIPEPDPDGRQITVITNALSAEDQGRTDIVERRTYSARAQDVTRKWFVVDAEGKTLGRLASAIAATIRGKNKPIYTPHADTGDFVIVINAEKIKVTGKKEQQHIYYSHSGYPGGLKSTSLQDMRARHPERIIENAVRGMIPRTTLGKAQLKKLKVFVGPEHPHGAQNPAPLAIDDTAARG